MADYLMEDENIDVCSSDSELGFMEGGGNDRKSHKQEMEKKRRARINESLTKLKSLVLQALKKDEARYSKLEKADILEMTVKFLQSNRHQSAYDRRSRNVEGTANFMAGFNQAAHAVSNFLGEAKYQSPELQMRINSHLANCMQTLQHRAAAPLSVQIPTPPPTATTCLPGQLSTTCLPGQLSVTQLPMEASMHPVHSLPLTPPHSPENGGAMKFASAGLLGLASQSRLGPVQLSDKIGQPQVLPQLQSLPVRSTPSGFPLYSKVKVISCDDSVRRKSLWRPF